MQLALARSLDWRWIAVRVAWAVIVIGLAASLMESFPRVWALVTGQVGRDWVFLTTAGDRVTAGLNPYGTADGFRYSPLVAHLFALIEPIGWAGYTALGFATLALLRDWRLIGLCLLLYPVWAELMTGLTMLPVVVLGVLALRGERWAVLGLVALAMLIPRPMMVPILGYVLWRERGLWAPSIAIAAALGVGAVLTGWAGEWITTLVSISAMDLHAPLPIKAWLGPAWWLLLPVAAWLTYHGRLGWAALAVSPYWTASYAMLPVLELRDRDLR